MKTSTSQARNLRPAISKTVLALAVASVIGGMAMTSAFADYNDNRQGHQDQGLHKGQYKGDRDRRDEYRREVQPVYRPVYQQPYRYSEPVYAPPPVYYDPRPSPGISLFFPLDIRF
jgi:hypothetical protein